VARAFRSFWGEREDGGIVGQDERCKPVSSFWGGTRRRRRGQLDPGRMSELNDNGWHNIDRMDLVRGKYRDCAKVTSSM
jgi:hypothetical protein